MPELDAVTQEFDADVRPYLAAMEEAKLATESLRNAILEMAAETGTAFAAMGDAMRSVAGSAVLTDAAERNLADASADLMMQTALLGSMEERLAVIQRDTADSSADLMMMNELLRASFDSLDGQIDDVIAHLAALKVAQDSSTRSGGTWLGYWRLSSTAIHWIIAGTAELLAVLAPAIVAAGAWAAVWVQGATNVYQHLTAAFDATEALGQQAGKTYGEMLGLHDVLQQAQNAANPYVYQALGAALNIVKEDSGGLVSVGTEMGMAFDRFAAQVVADFQKGGQAAQTMGDILAHMGSDLHDIGQFFVSLGAAIGSFASQMPGLAEFLLGTLDHLADLLKVIIEVAGEFRVGSWSILTFVLALEEFNRWGSLAVGGMDKLGLATTELSGKTGSYFLMGDRFIGILKNLIGVLPLAAFAVAGLVQKIPLIGAALLGTTEELNAAKVATMKWIKGLSALQTIGIVATAAGLAFMVYELNEGQTQMQKLADSTQKAAQAASNMDVLPVISSNLRELSSATAEAEQQLNAFTGTGERSGQVAVSLAGGWKGATIANIDYRNAVTQGNAATAQQVQDAANVVNNANLIAKTYGISVPDAFALATSAGAKLDVAMRNANGTWTANGELVRDAYAGYQAMGQSVGSLANDINVLAINSGVAGSKVQTLNSAWDSYMQTITGGTSDVANIIQGLGNVGTGIANVSENLSIGTAKFTASTSQFATDLGEVNQKGAQATQNFDQLIGTVSQLADWMRQAALETGASGRTLNQAALDAVSGLIPLAAHSATAQGQVVKLAQDIGWSGTSFSQLKDNADKTGASMSGLEGIVDGLTQKLGNMAGVAQQLGTTMNSQVAAAISNAALQGSGFTTVTNNLTKALANNGTYGGHTAAYWAQMAGEKFTLASKDAATLTGQMARATGAAEGLAGALRAASGNWFATMHVTTDYVTVGSAGAGGPKHAFQHGGMVSGAAGTDKVPIMATLGEGILTARAVSALGGPLALHALNDSPTAVMQAGALGGGGGVMSQTIHVTVMLDGSNIGTAQRTNILVYQRRNPSNNLNLRVR